MSEQLWICKAKADGRCNYDCLSGSDTDHSVPHKYTRHCDMSECGILKDLACIPYQPKEAPMEYKLIRPVSIKTLSDAGFSERELHRFAFLTAREMDLYEQYLSMDDIVNIASQCQNGIGWLKDEGFIREREPELKACAHCGFNHAELLGDQPSFYQILCMTCGMRTPIRSRKEEVIKIWNTRV